MTAPLARRAPESRSEIDQERAQKKAAEAALAEKKRKLSIAYNVPREKLWSIGECAARECAARECLFLMRVSSFPHKNECMRRLHLLLTFYSCLRSGLDCILSHPQQLTPLPTCAS